MPTTALKCTYNVSCAQPGRDAVARSTDLQFDLLGALGGMPDSTGSWTGPNMLPHSGIYNPLVDQPGIYTYTVPGVSTCSPAIATVDVSLIQAPDAGGDGFNTVCTNDPQFLLFNFLTGTPDQGGLWYFGAAGTHSPTFNPATDAPGSYLYVVSGGVACENDSAFVEVNLVPCSKRRNGWYPGHLRRYLIIGSVLRPFGQLRP